MDALKRAVEIAGTQEALARLIGGKQTTISDWLNVPGRKINPRAALEIELALDGKVTAAELRPDLWGPAPKAKAKRRAA
jgi:DNA-binding transcriptional regulator YdaS (Cro superfamily)